MAKENDKLTLLFNTINEAKNSLMESWNKNDKHFPYSFEKKEAGLMSDLIGSTSILLMLIAFRRESEVINKSDKTKIAELVNYIFPEILETIEKNGFVATPLVAVKDANILFNTETGYTDTVSWALSASLLARFAEFHNIIKISSKAHDAIFTIITQSFKQLINGQSEDGCWGFMTSGGAKSSLYYTYAAGIALGDFFDYAVGEIKEVENSNSGSVGGTKYKDHDLLNHLKDELGTGDVAVIAENARKKLSGWLLNTCLPALSDLSQCKLQNAEMETRVGMFSHNMTVQEDLNYFKLYYTYYIIDLMVVSKTDEDYKTIFNNRALPEYSEVFNAIKLKCDSDYEDYFFSEDTIAQKGILYWEELVSQAIHSSRYQYSNAARTGKEFFDGEASELNLKWENPNYNSSIKTIFKKLKKNLTDPALVPMSLRVNAMYGYYICEQADITVDNLFEQICGDVSKISDEKHVAGLWDTLGYNLLVTERSIEALVDYYDYIIKVGEKGVSQKSDFEESFNKKIYEYLLSEDAQNIIHPDGAENDSVSDYLKSDEGQKTVRQIISEDSGIVRSYFNSNEGRNQLQEIVKDLFGNNTPSAPANTKAQVYSDNSDDLVNIIAMINKLLKSADFIDSDNELQKELLLLYKNLDKFALYNLLTKVYKKEENETDTTYKKRICKMAEKITDGYRDLIATHAPYAGTNQGDLSRMYNRLKDSSFGEN